MVECAITAFKTVMEMDADPSIPEKRFDTKKSYEKVRKEIKTMLKGVDESDIDWIFCEATGVKRSELQDLTHIRQFEYEKALEYAKKRKTGMPLWRVFGKVDFYGTEIEINGDVLCPRPETEFLVEEAVKVVKQGDKVLDVCTGSGCIAIALAAKSQCSSVVASDISDKALEIAKSNAEKNNVADKVRFVESDLFDNIDGVFDVIVSNPPYIPQKDIAKLDREVKDYDPHIALDGGEDGLDFYRAFASKAKERLTDGGCLLLECGIDQAKSIIDMLDSDFDSSIVKDLQGIDRIIVAKKIKK
ncbi:MAG: peptide chain release factor N(5)-glutamine methyltransferase [Clostridia bacterium]|nr:peptide chain release factor N(5)-glutamine methyltransferase [Clostridia bacterium]